MKRALTIITAIALVLGLSQCKKKEVKPEATDQGIFITLDASYNGAKTGFDPATGNFVWTEGATEYIYVGGSQHNECLGVLSGEGTGTSVIKFTGTLDSAPGDGETLYFFYLGKRDLMITYSLYGAAALTSHLSDIKYGYDLTPQTGSLDDVTKYHIALGSEVYHTGQSGYSATLEIKTAFAYFDLSGFKSSNNDNEVVYVHGNDVYMNATINFREGTITPGMKGYINIGAANAGKYVALIPSTDEQTVVKFDSNSKTGKVTFVNGIQEGKFYAVGTTPTAMPVTASDAGDKGLFAAAGPYYNGDYITNMVRFSKGNLQYMPCDQTWRFAEHQYDMCVTADQLVDGYAVLYKGTSTYDFLSISDFEAITNPDELFDWYEQLHGAVVESQYTNAGTSWIDLFGWGTWGEGKIPYETSLNNSDYDWNTDFNGTIINDSHSGWRTLAEEGYSIGYITRDWTHLFQHRNNCGRKQGTGIVAGVNGLIILPEDFIDPCTNNGDQGFEYNNFYDHHDDINIYAEGADWDAMEAAGAIFIPASGYRMFCIVLGVGNSCQYWSSTLSNESNIPTAYQLYVGFYSNTLNYSSRYDRSCGNSVRLVRDVQ